MANALIHETSPYLLQHAHNPVNWVTWSDEVFEQAKADNKPVLISIGYSSCHWCHVMEHESFEDQETAQLMNNLFICVKIDREERPDIDHIYMDAVQAMTGQGGWPLHVFVNHDKKPFYGGTYFPPTRMYNRASWKETLINVSQYYTQNRNEVELQADKLINHLQEISKQKITKSEAENEIVFDVKMQSKKVLEYADTVHGGFGNAPKFPSTHTIKFLLNTYSETKDEACLKQAVLSLDKMMAGGIYDHVGGGFSRYSTDEVWLAPHFEKMLYDNALLIEVYALAYQCTKHERYKYVIEHTYQWLMREMYNGEGGFYSAQDADSEGVEGKYYTWAIEEIKNILKDEADQFCQLYNVAKEGNWEHTNILHLKEASDLPLKNNLQTLLLERNKRIKPLTDDKILLGWNALMIHALSMAGIYLQEEKYLLQAEKSLQCVLKTFKNEEGFYYHTSKNGVTKINCFADDAVYLTQACISVAKHKADTSYLQIAKNITEETWLRFKTADDILIQFTQIKHNQLQLPKYDTYDGAIPSVNAIMAKNLIYLSVAFHEIKFEELSSAMVQSLSTQILKFPTSFSCWSLIMLQKSMQLKEITIVGNDAKKYFLALNTKIASLNVLYIVSVTQNSKVESINGKWLQHKTGIYVCSDSVCLPPVFTIEEIV
jgi:uncharacterized protein YyaL (SSP411 family)